MKKWILIGVGIVALVYLMGLGASMGGLFLVLGIAIPISLVLIILAVIDHHEGKEWEKKREERKLGLR